MVLRNVLKFHWHCTTSDYSIMVTVVAKFETSLQCVIENYKMVNYINYVLIDYITVDRC